MVSAQRYRIGVVANRAKRGAPALLRDLRAALQPFPHVTLHWESKTARLLGETGAPLKKMLRQIDLLIVAGGDGTMLQIAHEIFPSPVPLLGVNIGSLGFLTSLVREELVEAAPLIAQQQLRTSARLTMQTIMYRGGKRLIIPCALNDVVVSRGDLSRLVRIRVKVAGQLVTEYVGDGLIIATPTGSTAYTLSAGGPIVSPEAQVLCLTPIAPHSLTTRPLVVAADAGVTLEVPAQPHALVVQYDGRPGGKLRAGDRIEIAPARAAVTLAYLPGSDFYRILRQKLKWSGASV